MRVEKSDFAVIEAKVLTMQMNTDFWDARQFQPDFPLSMFLAISGFVLPVRASQKPVICGVRLPRAPINSFHEQEFIASEQKTIDFERGCEIDVGEVNRMVNWE
jgi:hypothetical protein